MLGFETGTGGDVIAITELPSKNGKALDGLAITDGVLSLAKLGGCYILLADLDGIRHIDTVTAADRGIFLYVV